MRTITSAAPNRLVARLSTLSATAILGISAFVLLAPAAPAQAHDQLTGVQVETAETGEATGLKLSFSDNILEVGTEIIVTDASGASVADGTPKHSGREVTQPLETPLADGKYTSVWRVVSSDGHPIEGGFSFETVDGVAGEIMSLDASGDDHDAEGGEQEHADEHAAENKATPGAEPDAVAPSFATFAPYIGVGAGLAAIVVIAAFVMRARRNAAAPNSSPDSSEQE